MFYESIKNAVGKYWCNQTIREAEEIGFEKAQINSYGTQELNTAIRNNTKVQFFNEDLANDLYDFAPKLYKERKLSRIGDFFRVYKYEPGQYFKAHKDGSIETEEDESLLTMMIYLNTNDTAPTVLMPYGASQTWAHKDIPCEQASMLIFDHDIWHSGKTVVDGVKYVLRTDVFYF